MLIQKQTLPQMMYQKQYNIEFIDKTHRVRFWSKSYNGNKWCNTTIRMGDVIDFLVSSDRYSIQKLLINIILVNFNH